MATTAFSPAAPTISKPLEDPLAYLTRTAILEYRRGQLIYNQDQPATSLYLVMSGKVKVSRLRDDGQEAIVDIYQVDEFFGESSFLTLPNCSEQAMALEETRLMAWTVPSVEELMVKRPRLGIAILQILVDRTTEFKARIESFAVDNIERRLARTLIRYSDRMGMAQEDGTVRMMPLTHELLAQHVGTSREIVTQYMNKLRNQGYLQYSRKGISLHRDALAAWLRQSA